MNPNARPAVSPAPDALGGRPPRHGELAALLGPEAAAPDVAPPADFERSVRELLASPGVGPDGPPTASTSTDPIVPRPGFLRKFGRAAEKYTRAVRALQRRRAAIANFVTGDGPWEALVEQIEEVRGLIDREEAALGQFYACEDRLAALIRKLTGGRPVRLPEWEVPTGQRCDRCESYAQVEWGGAVFGLDDFGRSVTVRPAALTVRLG